MSSFKVIGGNKLRGELVPQGAKNETLQILSAVLLTSEKITIHNVPGIRDVIKLIDLLESLGVKVEKSSESTYIFQADDVHIDYLVSEEFKAKGSALRGSSMIVGPMLARFHKGYIPQPGGDKIGRRRLDTHFIGFEKLGAEFTYDSSENFFKAEASELKGCYLHMDEASVTGTANLVMAAVLAKGTTTIYNAACEPYLQQLCTMLNNMGANISGIASNMLTIEGVDALGGCTHTILPDMIEIGSFIGMVAITRSEMTIKNTAYDKLGIITNVVNNIGIGIEARNDEV